MTESITETAYGEIKKLNKLIFSEDYLKSTPFHDIIHDIFSTFASKYIFSVLMFQLALEVALTIRHPPQIFKTYTRRDKNNLKNFLKTMRHITSHLNKANNALYNISEFVSNSSNNKNWSE